MRIQLITLTLSLSFSSAAASLAACGAAQTPAPEGPDAASPATPDQPDIAGRWVSECMAQPDGQTFAALDFDITDATWALDYTVYGDDACQAQLVTVHIDGPYEIGDPSDAVDGAFDGVFGFTTKTITPHVQPLADMLASAEGCGSGSWEVGVTGDVYGTGCPAFGQYPREQCSADYDLVAVDGDRLQFGQRPADNNMCTPDRRPTALNPGAFTRQGDR